MMKSRKSCIVTAARPERARTCSTPRGRAGRPRSCARDALLEPCEIVAQLANPVGERQDGTRSDELRILFEKVLGKTGDEALVGAPDLGRRGARRPDAASHRVVGAASPITF